MLISVNMPLIESIGNYAFENCVNLETVSLSSSLSFIGKGAFEGCVKLHTIIIPSAITIIYEYVFSMCSGLISINIPLSVKSIETFAFGYCYGLVSITINPSVTNISKYAFYKCSRLESITIPSSLEIDNTVFEGCTKLTTLIITDSHTKYINESLWERAISKNIPNVSRVWASDSIIALLDGPFEDYSTYADLPPALQAAPLRIKSYTALELWRWWSPPDIEIPSHKYHLMLWTALLVSERHSVTEESNPLYIVSEVPQEIWMIIFEFCKRDVPVIYYGT